MMIKKHDNNNETGDLLVVQGCFNVFRALDSVGIIFGID